MNNRTIGVDLSKDVFEIAVSRVPGQVRERRRLSRPRLMQYFTSTEPATVVMEACGTSHYWGRWLREAGHEVVLLPPQYVRPYVRRNKTDRADAKGILEAYRNDEIEAVPVKGAEQQAMTTLHHLRSAWVSTRTRRLNQVRASLRELGIAIPVGARHVLPTAQLHLEDAESLLPMFLRPALHEALEEIRDLEKRIASVERELMVLGEQIREVQLLLTIPGIGVLTATALVAYVEDFGRFRSGRSFSNYLGLTCRESSTGKIRRLGRISKKGNTYLRALLVQGGRAVLIASKRKKTEEPLRVWALEAWERLGWHRATVAVANKLGRIVWAVASRGEAYRMNMKEK